MAEESSQSEGIDNQADAILVRVSTEGLSVTRDALLERLQNILSNHDLAGFTDAIESSKGVEGDINFGIPLKSLHEGMRKKLVSALNISPGLDIIEE